jgi:hypothetical protein
MNQEIIDEIECSLALLKPSALRVKPINLLFENGRFSGIWAKYQPEWSSENVSVFIPHNELKSPYYLRSAAEDLIKSGTAIEVYPLKIDANKQSCDPKQWQLPICTMFSSNDRDRAVVEDEEIKLVGSNIEEINIKKGTIIKSGDLKLEVIDVEYHNNENGCEKRPKSVSFRITAPSKYPILRLEQEKSDFEKWENLPGHDDRKSSTKIRRFFYKKRGMNSLKIGEIKITLFPIFSESERKRLELEGYVGKIRIFYPDNN